MQARLQTGWRRGLAGPARLSGFARFPRPRAGLQARSDQRPGRQAFRGRALIPGLRGGPRWRTGRPLLPVFRMRGGFRARRCGLRARPRRRQGRGSDPRPPARQAGFQSRSAHWSGPPAPRRRRHPGQRPPGSSARRQSRSRHRQSWPAGRRENARTRHRRAWSQGEPLHGCRQLARTRHRPVRDRVCRWN